jgi:hypothetical protein
MGVFKKKAKKSSSRSSGSSLGSRIRSTASAVLGGKSGRGGGGHRKHGVTWYQNAVLKEKLKKKLFKIKYGGR